MDSVRGDTERGEARESTRPPGGLAELARALPWLLLLPLVLIGPSLLPGRRFLPLAPVSLAPLAAEHPEAARVASQGIDYLGSDGLFPLLTDAERIGALVRAGELPLWDATAGLGAPLFAQTMFGVLYPPHALAYVLPADVAFGWIALLALCLAGLGLFRFARTIGLGVGAALCGAIAFQGAGFATANLHDLIKVEAGLWLPWALAGVERVLAGRRKAALEVAGATTLAWLAGFPPIAVFTTLAAFLYLATRGLLGRGLIGNSPSDAGSGSNPAHVLRAGAALALGVLLAAVQWIPMLEAWSESARGERASAASHADAPALSANLTLVAPAIFGRADEPVFAPANAGVWWLARAAEKERAMNANLLEWNSFVGALALALAAAAVAARPRQAAFPLVVALAALGFAQGWPGFALLARLPGLDLGSPARAGVLTWFAAAWLTALGAEVVLARERGARAALVACGALVLLAAALVHAGDGERWAREQPETLAARFSVAREVVDAVLAPQALLDGASRVRSAGLALLGFAALALLAVLGTLLLRPRRVAPWLALALVLAAEGAWYARPHVAPRRVEGVLWPRSTALDALREAAGDGRVLRLDESESGVADVLDLARPNLPAAYGVADLSPYVVFTPRRAVELLTAIDPRARFRSGASRLSDEALLDHPVLDVLRVTAILSRRPLASPRLTPVVERDGFHVYRRTGVPPRARLATLELRTAASDAPRVLAARLSDPNHGVVVPAEAPRVELDRNAPPEEPPGSVTIVPDPPGRPGRTGHPGYIELDVRANRAAWLVLADAWYPGWRATIDGREIPVTVVDHALRGIPIPPGDHRVTFTYQPASLRRGAWLSLATLLAILLLARTRASGARPGPVS